jgi:predicted small lipoprotein YifL
MRIIKTLSAIAATLALAACGGDQPAQDTLTVPPVDSTAAVRAKRTQNIFHNIPSPMETAALLKKAGADYDKDILNDVRNVDNYTAASKQALNLGVYGADLSYASVFNNTQESMLYTSCAQKLAKKLDVSDAFNAQVVDRLEKNRNNRDSLLSIISETYWQVDGYLKENQRDNISALMIAGGWVEGLYIASQVAKVHDTPELRQRIAEQKLPLVDLIALVRTYSPDDPAVSSVLQDLQTMDSLYTDVVIPHGNSTIEQDKGVAVIGGTAPMAALTDVQLASLTSAIATIRAKYIN